MLLGYSCCERWPSKACVDGAVKLINSTISQLPVELHSEWKQGRRMAAQPLELSSESGLSVIFSLGLAPHGNHQVGVSHRKQVRRADISAAYTCRIPVLTRPNCRQNGKLQIFAQSYPWETRRDSEMDSR